MLTDPLPAGVTYVPGSASASGYDAATQTLTWALPDLVAGATASLTFQARVTDAAADEILNRATLTAAGTVQPLEAVAGVRVLQPPAEAVIIPDQGGTLRAADARIEVVFPPSRAGWARAGR